MALSEFPGSTTNGFGLLLAAAEAVVLVNVAGGAEGLVVEADAADGLGELFLKLMDGVELGGGGGQFELPGPNELLIAAIKETSDFSPHKNAGTLEEGGCTALSACCGDEDGGCAVFGDEHAASDSVERGDRKAAIAEGSHALVECGADGLFGHC